MKKFDEIDMLNPEPVFLDLIIEWFKGFVASIKSLHIW